MREEYHPEQPVIRPEAARPVEALDPHKPEDLEQLKSQYSAAMLVADFDLAERAVAQIETADQFSDVCRNYRKAIENKRRGSN